MSDSLCDIVFTGQLVEGFELAAVKQQVTRLLKLDVATTDKIFQGKPVTLQKNLEPAVAEKYLKVLTQTGMRVELHQKQPVEVPQKQPRDQLERQSAAGKTVLTQTRAFGGSAKGLLQHFPPVDTWQVDELGVRLSPLQKIPTAPISRSDLSVTPQEGNILSPDERPLLVASDIDFSVLDSLTVNGVGEYLMPLNEQAPSLEVTIDTSHLSVEPASGYLLKKSEIAVPVDVVIDTRKLSLK